MAESHEEQFERISGIVQQSILKGYPNPTREGCPGDAAVREVASRSELKEDALWQHITHCSPCYAEFLRIKEEIRAGAERHRATTRRRLLTAGGVLLTTGLAAVVVRERENRVKVIEVDLQNFENYRGVGDGTTPSNHSSIGLPRGRIHLVLLLLHGSATGTYRVQLWSDPASLPLISKNVDSISSGGRERLETDLDVRLTRGDYTLGIRNDGREAWRYVPVHVMN
jgi:hypothetical protein